MCRHLAYVGAPIALADPVLRAPHSLVRQAQCPRHQTSGTENPDGFGITWYDPGAPIPHRYRAAVPMWQDTDVESVIAHVATPAFVGAARLASPGAPIEVSGNAPFVSGPWSFSLNGLVHAFTEGVGDALRADITPERRAEIRGHADTEVLFAMVLDRLDAGVAPAPALVDTVHEVERHQGGRLNCILTDGRLIVATAVGNSLFVRPGWVASEPLDDDDRWTRVADRTVVTLTDGALPIQEAM